MLLLSQRLNLSLTKSLRRKRCPPPPPPVVRGFSSGEDSDSNTDGFSAADVLSDDSSDSNYEPAQKKKRKRSASSSDESLCDGDFNMFDPLAVKKNKLSSVQSSYVRKMFSKLIKAEDLEGSFETLGIEKSSDPSLQVKELDPELLDVIPGSHFVNKSDKSLTAIESRVLRAATPALSLWSKLQAARNDQKTAVDVNKLITLAEASVCALGQASVDVKFQRRIAVASRILKDKKKAKNVIHQNADVLENEKKYLFGSSFTKQLVKRISRSNKLKETLLKVQNWKVFRKSGRGKSHQFQPSKQYHRPTATTTSIEAHSQPFQQGPLGNSTNRGGKGRGKKPYSRYVPICLSEQKSICISSKRKFWFKGRHCSKTVKRHCLTYTTDSQKLVVENGVSTNCGSSKSWGADSMLHTKLEDPDSGSLDFGCSSREGHQLGKCPSTRQVPTTTELQQISLSQNRPRSTKNDRYGSYRTMSRVPTSGHQHTVSQREERWGCSSHIQPEKSQPFHGISTFQIRRDSSSHRHHSERGLHVQNRYFQCILDNSNTPQRQKIDEISLERENIPISSMDLWSRPSPKMVHKAHETSDSISEETRDKKRHLYGRSVGGGEFDLEVSVLHSHIRTELLEMLGFVINREKSILSPTQILDDCLGFIINSQEMSLSLQMKKILKIQQACRNLLQKKTVSVRELSKVLGQLVATARAVFQAPLHYRKLQMSQISTPLKNQRRYNAKLQLTPECKQELTWWIKNLSDWNGKSFITIVPPGLWW